jgi:Na+/melibiose symporter-like transporter
MAQKKISKLNLLLFSFAGFGQNIVYAMMITYVIDYFTLKLGVIAGVVMLAARILDALLWTRPIVNMASLGRIFLSYRYRSR